MELLPKHQDLSVRKLTENLKFKYIRDREYTQDFLENGILTLNIRKITPRHYGNPETQATLNVGLKNKGSIWQSDLQSFNAPNYHKLYESIDVSKDDWGEKAKILLAQINSNFISANEAIDLIRESLNSEQVEDELDEFGHVTFKVGNKRMIRVQVRSNRLEILVGKSTKRLTTIGRKEDGILWDKNNLQEGLDMANDYLQNL